MKTYSKSRCCEKER